MGKPTWYVEDEDLVEEGEGREEENAAEEEVDEPLLVPTAAPQLRQDVVELQRHFDRPAASERIRFFLCRSD